MNRPILVFLLAIACSPTVFGQEVKNLPAVKRILDKATAEVKKNRQEFDRDNEKPLASAKQELEDLAKKLIEDKKNAEAQAVLRQVQSLEVDVMKLASAPPPAPNGLQLANDRRAVAVRQALISSRWLHNNQHAYSFTPDGKYVLQGTARHGNYILSEDAKHVVLMWNNEDRVEVIVVGDRPETWKFRDGSSILPQR